MGCSICPSVSKSKLIYKKTDTILMNQPILFKKLSEYICLKIDIQPSLHPIIFQDLKKCPSLFPHIENYLRYINYIKSTYSLLESSENNFKFQTHSVCLEPNLNNSIKVLLISIFSTNKGQYPIRLIDNLPFFSIEVSNLSQFTLSIYHSWTSYCEALEVILKPQDPTLDLMECEKRLCELLRDCKLHKECFAFIEFGLFKDFLKTVIELCKYIDKKVKKTVLGLKNYFSHFKYNERKIRLLGLKAWEIGANRGKDIVHSVLNNQQLPIFPK